MRLHYGGLENGEKNRDWSSSMEGRFGISILKIISFPFFLFEKVIPMGIQIIILEKVIM
jgi:hypothetical protein